MRPLQPSSVLLAGFLSAACLSPAVAAAKSTLFEGGTIISFDDDSQTIKVLRDHSLLVTGDRIAAIFDTPSNATNVSIPADAERVPATGKIISPGFVDTHRHGWQTAYKTLGSNTTLGEYFSRYGEFTQAATVFTPDDVYYGQLAGVYEALNAGVTSILEHAHATFSNDTARAYLNASLDSGVRMWWCYAFHTLDNGFSVPQQMANFRDLLADERLQASTTVLPGIAYDAFATGSADEVAAIVDLATSENISAITTHYLGGPWFNANSPAKLNDLALLNGTTPIVFSHASYLTPEDAALLRTHNHYISTTPESEMHYGHGHESTDLAADQAALGVDTHFTFSSDILTQARLWLQSTRLKWFVQRLHEWSIPATSPMSASQAFLLATRAGGLALRRPDIGVLSPGAVADIVLFDGTAPNMLGWWDPVAAVILHANVGDVKDVMVGGEWRKRDGELVLKQDRSVVEENFLKSAKRIQRVWLETPAPLLEGEYQAGVRYERTHMVDVVRGNGTGY
ncbi:uncharacterized protein K452DRAFT_284219 [Aplosporella prunicola CBS 121167]|uniref:Amidohydrolase-related domain-containing protein n=1 Tax=Aplosporella prunicola CBS 121167 TaxID=1176127 RepID=A0A6A6BP38_9PEZI|nr:uncharacterized protein K452DRAFT_284219 [Aplosporella prunicola CBS 121167]KAF2145836.1 hypothetical protein K452DRAFT_284219 [Aplosporella prunicola CBS 121167]